MPHHQSILKWEKRVDPYTLKSDQFHISLAASPEIFHHTVWRTWFFIVSHKTTTLPIPTTPLTSLKFGRIYLLSLGVKELKCISPFRSGFFVLQKNVLNAGFRHVMDVFQGACIFFQALEFRLSERWPSGSGDWEPWRQRSKTLWSLHCFLVVRTLFFGLVYLCCWVILRFLDSGRIAEERERSSGVYFPVFAEYFWASDFPDSSREAGTKLMIDGRKCHLLDPVVQRKDELTDGEAYPTDKTANHSIVMHQLKTEPLHETRMAPE